MPLPKKFGRYEIIDLIATTAMGVLIYKARDPVLDQVLVLKVGHAIEGFARTRELWLREVRALGSLDHPNIVKAYDAGECDARFYITTQFIEGTTLDLVVRRGPPISLRQAIDVTIQISDALQYVHLRGIVHRNVKPEYIALSPNGKATLDGFTLISFPGNPPETWTPLIGTLPYMSPEQLAGQPVDTRSDIFSLGCTFYELVEGRQPFEGPSSPDVAMKILHGPAPQSQQAHKLRLPQLQRIFDNALATNRNDRYSSCAELHVDLLQLKEQLGN